MAAAAGGGLVCVSTNSTQPRFSSTNTKALKSMLTAALMCWAAARSIHSSTRHQQHMAKTPVARPQQMAGHSVAICCLQQHTNWGMSPHTLNTKITAWQLLTLDHTSSVAR
jgi:hypothetical protein